MNAEEGSLKWQLMTQTWKRIKTEAPSNTQRLLGSCHFSLQSQGNASNNITCWGATFNAVGGSIPSVASLYAVVAIASANLASSFR